MWFIITTVGIVSYLLGLTVGYSIRRKNEQ